MNHRFQRLAARLPIIRLIANQQALALHHITAGFVYSQILQACVQLNLFSLLKKGPLSAAQLAGQTGLKGEGLQTLLKAAASLQLIDRLDDDLWGLGQLGTATLAYPGISAMVDHHALLYKDLVDPVALLSERKSTHLSAYWPYAQGTSNPDAAARYSALMADSLAIISTHILDACSLRHARCLIDVGGGSGAFAAAAIARHPQLKAIVADLPEVVTSAEAQRRAGATPSLSFTAVNVFKQSLPAGADVVSLVRILHDHDDDKALMIVRAVRRAMKEGGQLLVAEPLANTAGAEAIGHGYFGMYLWAMASGRPRTVAEIGQLLRAGGFSDVKEHRSNVPALVRVISATANSVKNY